MRLGLIGPANGDLAALAKTAEALLNGARVTRAIYLGADPALEEAVQRWAAALVGGDPSDAELWSRALGVAEKGSPSEIDDFLRRERGRQRLKALESLREGNRSVEMIGDRMAVLINDKAMLDEEDIFAATFLVYGKSDTPLLKQIGPRWFLTPGNVGSQNGGSAVIEDDGEEIKVTIYGPDGTATSTEALPVVRTTKMRVQGDQ